MAIQISTAVTGSVNFPKPYNLPPIPGAVPTLIRPSAPVKAPAKVRAYVPQLFKSAELAPLRDAAKSRVDSKSPGLLCEMAGKPGAVLERVQQMGDLLLKNPNIYIFVSTGMPPPKPYKNRAIIEREKTAILDKIVLGAFRFAIDFSISYEELKFDVDCLNRLHTHRFLSARESDVKLVYNKFVSFAKAIITYNVDMASLLHLQKELGDIKKIIMKKKMSPEDLETTNKFFQRYRDVFDKSLDQTFLQLIEFKKYYKNERYRLLLLKLQFPDDLQAKIDAIEKCKDHISSFPKLSLQEMIDSNAEDLASVERAFNPESFRFAHAFMCYAPRSIEAFTQLHPLLSQIMIERVPRTERDGRWTDGADLIASIVLDYINPYPGFLDIMGKSWEPISIPTSEFKDLECIQDDQDDDVVFDLATSFQNKARGHAYERLTYQEKDRIFEKYMAPNGFTRPSANKPKPAKSRSCGSRLCLRVSSCFQYLLYLLPRSK